MQEQRYCWKHYGTESQPLFDVAEGESGGSICTPNARAYFPGTAAVVAARGQQSSHARVPILIYHHRVAAPPPIKGRTPIRCYQRYAGLPQLFEFSKSGSGYIRRKFVNNCRLLLMRPPSSQHHLVAGYSIKIRNFINTPSILHLF